MMMTVMMMRIDCTLVFLHLVYRLHPKVPRSRLPWVPEVFLAFRHVGRAGHERLDRNRKPRQKSL